jgi:hypothetical protein
MKKLIFLLIVPIVSYGQYSNYYNVDVNSYSDVNVSGAIDVNVKKNISGNVNVNKTIRTIDYGALAQANAIRQRNSIERLKINDAKERRALIAIANDPVKAFDYGELSSTEWGKQKNKGEYFTRRYGIKKFKIDSKIPHNSLFQIVGWHEYENLSENNIRTNIKLYPPINLNTKYKEFKKEYFLKQFGGALKDLERFSKLPDYIVGIKNKSRFVHSKDINRAKLFVLDGYKSTLALEDDYEIMLNDYYFGELDGIIYYAEVKYSADKDESNFEELEGRRYYFRKLVDKIISTTNVYDIKK